VVGRCLTQTRTQAGRGRRVEFVSHYREWATEPGNHFIGVNRRTGMRVRVLRSP